MGSRDWHQASKCWRTRRLQGCYALQYWICQHPLPPSFPRHLLTLKKGMVLMVLRNISPKEGLCNGTKVIYKNILNNKLLVCKLTTSNKSVLIPRIKFISEQGSYAFEWSRHQFPVRIAFATTINKAQGQTLNKVGVWLRSLVFGHGQLYVAASRTGNPDNLKFAIKEQQGELFRYTANVVYNEVLLQQDVDEPPVPRSPAGPKGAPSPPQEREGGQL